MKLYITKGSGTGLTELAAFDSAVLEAEVGNQNLIYLSSVIPPDSTIVHEAMPLKDSDFGSRLYCVLSEQRTSIVGEEAWAGIGWVQEVSTGRGVFIEHHGHSEVEVVGDINSSLETMMNSRPEIEWGEIGMCVEGSRCIDKPTCSLVVATFKVVAW